MARLALPLAVLLAALALVACGESGEEKYAKGFQPINRQIVQLGEAVGADLQKKPSQQVSDSFGGYAQQLGELQQKLDTLEPPEELVRSQSRLVSAMGQMQGRLEAVAGAAEKGDERATRSAQAGVVRAAPQLRQARTRLAAGVARIQSEDN